MTRASVQLTSATLEAPCRSRARLTTLAWIAAAVLVVGACGGDDDDEDSASTTTGPADTTASPVITQPETTVTTATTAAPAPTTVVYVTEGAAVLVTNASRVNGAAGRLSERLAAVGYSMVTPGNYTLGDLEVSKIYFDPTNPAAKAVADSLKAAFGGGAIEVIEMTTPPPVDTGDLAGAGVLVAMGNDIADKTLEEMQGIVTTTTAESTESTTAASTETTEA